MSSIIRARNGLTGRSEVSEVIGLSPELKVAGPSMLGIGCPDRHALLRFTSTKMRRPRHALPPARAGSFYDPLRTLGSSTVPLTFEPVAPTIAEPLHQLLRLSARFFWHQGLASADPPDTHQLRMLKRLQEFD